MIRDMRENDRKAFFDMAKEFYSSNAVDHNVDFHNFEITFDAIMNKSPFLRGLIVEDEGMLAGYALLSFTYSNEVGGIVILVEELYISEDHRGKGLAGDFFEFLEQEYPNAKRFRLEVRADNERAISLYKRLGYKELEYIQMIKDF